MYVCVVAHRLLRGQCPARVVRQAPVTGCQLLEGVNVAPTAREGAVIAAHRPQLTCRQRRLAHHTCIGEVARGQGSAFAAKKVKAGTGENTQHHTSPQLFFLAGAAAVIGAPQHTVGSAPPHAEHTVCAAPTMHHSPAKALSSSPMAPSKSTCPLLALNSRPRGRLPVGSTNSRVMLSSHTTCAHAEQNRTEHNTTEQGRAGQGRSRAHGACW